MPPPARPTASLRSSTTRDTSGDGQTLRGHRGRISAQKKTLFCTRTGPNRRPPPGFFRFRPIFHAQGLTAKANPAKPKQPTFPAGNGQFSPRRATCYRGFFWFFCCRKGGPAPPQKIPSLSPARPLCTTHKINTKLYLRLHTVTTEKSIFLATRGPDVTTSACRRHKRSEVWRFPSKPVSLTRRAIFARRFTPPSIGRSPPGSLTGSPQAFFTSATTSYSMNPLAAGKMTL